MLRICGSCRPDRSSGGCHWLKGSTRREPTSRAAPQLHTRRRLPFLPAFAGPVPAARMLTERDARARFPCVLVDGHMSIRRVAVFFVHMPAGIAGAGNVGPRAYRREGQNGCTHCRAEQCFRQRLHFVLRFSWFLIWKVPRHPDDRISEGFLLRSGDLRCCRDNRAARVFVPGTDPTTLDLDEQTSLLPGNKSPAPLFARMLVVSARALQAAAGGPGVELGNSRSTIRVRSVRPKSLIKAAESASDSRAPLGWGRAAARVPSRFLFNPHAARVAVPRMFALALAVVPVAARPQIQAVARSRP